MRRSRSMRVSASALSRPRVDRRGAHRLLAAAVGVLTLAVLLQQPALAGHGPTSHPWAVVLCNFSNNQAQPNTLSYYERMYTDAGVGEGNLVEYWRDISYGNTSLSGSRVTGWHTVPHTRDEWIDLDRGSKVTV